MLKREEDGVEVQYEGYCEKSQQQKHSSSGGSLML
jgi:hypothetical protein